MFKYRPHIFIYFTRRLDKEEEEEVKSPIMTERMDFDQAWIEAHYLNLVLDMQHADLFQTALSNLGIKGKEANGLKADYWTVMAQRLKMDGHIEDAVAARKTAADIRKLGEREMSSLSWDELFALGAQETS